MQWLKHYVPRPVLRAIKALADYVDFTEEETFRLPNGQWRTRELTLFLDAGSAADRTQESRLRELLQQYIDLVVLKRKESCISDATSRIRRWLILHHQTPHEGDKGLRHAGRHVLAPGLSNNGGKEVAHGRVK